MTVARSASFSALTKAGFSVHLIARAAHIVLLGTLAAAPGFVQAQASGAPAASASAARRFDIPAGPLAPAVSRFAGAAGVAISFSSADLKGLQSPGLQGLYSVEEGFSQLLRGSGWKAEPVGGGNYALRKLSAAESEAADSVSSLPQVVVTALAQSPGDLPAPYSGGQVARGGRVGLLGNKDFMDTPFSVTSYTAQTVQDQQARTIADVVDNNPAFRFIYPDNDVTTDFTVRGNKVKALDIAYGGLYGLTSPGVEALERVEVITGANALLNGLGPIGGVGGSINLVPKRATSTPLTRLSTGYISDSQFGVSADVSRRFGEDERLGVRFNGAYSDGDTATEGQSKKIAMGALALDYRKDNVRLSADLGYRKNDAQSPSRTTYVLSGFPIPAPPPSGQNWQQRWSYDNTESLMGTLRGEVDISPDLTAYAAVGASRMREEELFANSILYAANGNLLQRQVYWPVYRDSSTAETGLRGRFVTGTVGHSWVVSASGLWVSNGIILNNLANTYTNIYAPVFIAQPSIAGLAGPSDVPKTGETTASGLAVADTLSMMDDRLQVMLGLRYQSVKSENFSPTNGSTLTSYDKSVTTPGVGVLFKAADNVSLYANYIEGLQQGPTAAAGSSNAGEVFAPYVSKQYEAGVKVDFGGFATTLGAYQLTTPNGFTDPKTLVYGINGEQRTRGLELNTFGEITRGVRLLGGVAFVNAKQTATAGGINDGKQVTGAPKVQFNLGGEWDIPGIQGLTFSARAIYTDGQYLDLANLQPIPSWTRYDAGVRYRTQWNGTPTTIRLNVQNLTNKSYWAAAVDGYLVQSSPRTLQLSATFDF
ncbi:TonB-dependent receptor [Variovorax sp. Sphag1AA]|uniref:TonB-dependent receptor n=1 Tax=Variovorax sp. Sphag1AA TaxID=2587027 RepID=UPI00160CEB88|nr:TonB-dependent receptor [Variovorax sp. Sphag1AA]MBB3181866.1 iron complex outermembrane receptor protein [Variovorax sp. Sphag1AA]